MNFSSRRNLILAPVVLLLAAPAFAQGATTLPSAFQAALKRSETLAQQEQQLSISEERTTQALGSILPNLSASGTYILQDTPTDPVAAAFFPQSQPTVKLSLTQPIFRGLRELAALRQAKRLVESQEQAIEAAKLQLYRDTATSYFAVLSLEEGLKIFKTQHDLYDAQLSDLNRRVRSGQSSQTDPLTLETSQADLDAQIQALTGQIQSARQTFAFMTGLPAETELSPLESRLPKPAPMTEYLGRIEERPDILALKSKVEASEQTIRIAKGGHLPSADVSGNYYFVRPSPIFNEINWDVQATLTLPIYSGGVVSSQVREAAATNKQAELELTRARRYAEQEIRSLHATYAADLAQLEVRERAVKLAERNHTLLRSDYQRNLTRSLDVLQGLRGLQESQRALTQTRFTARTNLIRLQTAAAPKLSALP